MEKKSRETAEMGRGMNAIKLEYFGVFEVLIKTDCLTKRSNDFGY